MTHKKQALWVGSLILAGVGALLILAFKVSQLNRQSLGTRFYYVTAVFDHIGNLKIQAPVTLSGVPIGKVKAIQLDPATLKAQVTLAISANQNQLPKDSAASILTQGFLGSSYVALQPGFENHFLKNGDRLLDTRPALVLENLIHQLVFSFANKK